MAQRGSEHVRVEVRQQDAHALAQRRLGLELLTAQGSDEPARRLRAAAVAEAPLAGHAHVHLEEPALAGVGVALGLHAGDADEAGLVEHALGERGGLGQARRLADGRRAEPGRVLAQLVAAEAHRVAAVGEAHDDRLLDVVVAAGDVLAEQHREPVLQRAAQSLPRLVGVGYQEHALVAVTLAPLVREGRLDHARPRRVGERPLELGGVAHHRGPRHGHAGGAGDGVGRFLVHQRAVADAGALEHEHVGR
jgi:hypothetical protein